MTTNMFKNWQDLSEDYIPNNSINWQLPPDGIRDIIRGTTPEHFLYLPFSVISDVLKLQIIYEQECTSKIIKTLDDITVYRKKPNVVYYQFTEEETNSFEAIKNKPVKIQVRAQLKNYDVIAGSILKINVLDVLDDTILADSEGQLIN